MAAGGVLLRIALCRPWFPSVLWMVGHSLGVMLFWPVLAAVVLLGQPRVAMALSVGAAAVFVLLAYRKRNLVNAMFSVAMWHLAAAAMLHGFTRRLTPPTQAIDTEVVALPRQPGDVRLPACAATPS